MTPGDQLLQFVISGITIGSVYSIIGLAIAIIFNVGNIFDVSQGQFMMLGAMSVCVFRAAGLAMGFSIALGVLIPLIGGLVIFGIIFYRIVQRYSLIAIIMITLGVGLLIEGIAFLALGADTRVTPYYVNIAPIRIRGATMSPQAPFLFAVLLLMVLGLYLLFNRSFLGKGLRACREQPLAARLMGINPAKMIYFSFALAVVLGAIGGIVMVPMTATSYKIGMELTIKGFLSCLVGGIWKFQGVILGGLCLGLFECLAAGLISSNYASVIALSFFLIVLLLRPSGILGTGEIIH